MRPSTSGALYLFQYPALASCLVPCIGRYPILGIVQQKTLKCDRESLETIRIFPEEIAHVQVCDVAVVAF